MNDCEAGFLHCVALEKEEIPPIQAWSTQRLIKWFEKKKWEDCARLAKYHNIIGKTIAEANEEYLEDTLGIKDFSQKNLFKTEVE